MANAVVIEPDVPATSERATEPVVRIQGNWKRRPGVATRYELALAIDRLLELGKVEIDEEGMLSLPQRGRIRMRLALVRVSREDRWARQDDALRAYCEQIEPHETRSRKAAEYSMDAGSLFEATVHRGSPRRGVRRYVLRELAKNGRAGYSEVIEVIFDKGGLEWVLEEPVRVTRRGKGKRR